MNDTTATITTAAEMTPETFEQQFERETAGFVGLGASDEPKGDNNPAVPGEMPERKEGEQPNGQESAPANNEKPDVEPGDGKKTDEMPAQPAEGADEEAPKKKGGFQRRIERLKKRNEALQRQLDEVTAKASTTSTAEPDIADFESYDEYLSARDAWRDGQKQQGSQTAGNDEDAQLQRLNDAYSTVTETFDDAREKYSDFDAVVLKNPADGGPEISPEMVVAMAECDEPGEVAYWLGKHHEEASRIARMDDPRSIARAISRIEGRIEAEASAPKPQPQKKTTTKAPDPPSPVDSGGAANNKSLVEMDFETFERIRNEEEFGRR